MFYFYAALNVAILAVTMPLWMVLVFATRKYRQSFRERAFMSGFEHGRRNLDNRRRDRIWIHALSVGEVLSAEPLVTDLAERYGADHLIFTASTRTGYQTARRIMAPHVHAIRYFPYDTPISVMRAVQVIRPERVIVVETDIWPVFLRLLSICRIPVSLVNARLSTRSFRGYERFRFLVKPLLQTFERVCVQTESDCNRFRRLGVTETRLVTTGNLKFDQPPVAVSTEEIQAMRAALGLSPDMPVWIAGSTHAGEETILADALQKIRTAGFDPLLIVAPRNPDRALDVVGGFNRAGIRADTLARIEADTSAASVVVVDRIGLLRNLYALADIAFVGGSLVSAGGHNPLEPASLAKPILFGPWTDDFRWICQALESAGGGWRVGSAAALADAVCALLADREQLVATGRRAKTLFRQHRGAVLRTLAAIGL